MVWLVAHKVPKAWAVVDGWQLAWGNKLLPSACVEWGHAGYLYSIRSSSISDFPEEEESILCTLSPHC